MACGCVLALLNPSLKIRWKANQRSGGFFALSNASTSLEQSVCACCALRLRYGPQRMPKSSATLVLSSGTGGERVMWWRLTMRVVEKAIFGPI